MRRKGTKGISLFLVPKRLPDADGDAGVANALKVVSLEHKMGLHGSPTCVMQYDGATGWLIGEPNGGMAAMFTMMNNARLGVGVHALGAGEAAYQHALAYARDRVQGRRWWRTGTGTILDHADVRRMLTGMKAEIFAARALSLDLAVSIDMATATGDAAGRARAAFLTPIAKNYGSRNGRCRSPISGIQVHGGMGFIEETGAAQFARDVRVSAIYEGTTGIQGMDLVGRKLSDGGEAAFALLDEARERRGTRRKRDALSRTGRGGSRARQRSLAMESERQSRRIGAVCARLRADAGRSLPPQGGPGRPGWTPRGWRSGFLARQMAAVPGLLSEATQGARRPLCPVAGRPRGVIRYPARNRPAPGSAVEVAPGILWLRLPLPMALNHVNVYALKDEDGWTLSIPALNAGAAGRRGRRRWRAACRCIRSAGSRHPSPSRPRGPRRLVPGAGGGASDDADGMAFCAHADARRAGGRDARADRVLDGAGMAPEILDARRSERPFNFADMVAPMPLGFTRLEEGQRPAARRARLGGPLRSRPCARPRNALVRGRRGRHRRRSAVCRRSRPISGLRDRARRRSRRRVDRGLPRLQPFATERSAGPAGPQAALHRPARPSAADDRQPRRRARRCARISRKARGRRRSASRRFSSARSMQGTYGLALVEAVAHLNHLF
jgi:hypothetical protein